MSSQGVNEVFSYVGVVSLVKGGLGRIHEVGMSFLFKEVSFYVKWRLGWIRRVEIRFLSKGVHFH